MVAAARRQVQRGLGLVVLVIHRVAVLVYLVLLGAAITTPHLAQDILQYADLAMLCCHVQRRLLVLVLVVNLKNICIFKNNI